MPSGKKRWRYRRIMFGKDLVAKLFGGLYPVTPTADARAWARSLNEKVEAGLDPRVTQREGKALAKMTVAKTHVLYMRRHLCRNRLVHACRPPGHSCGGSEIPSYASEVLTPRHHLEQQCPHKL
ncbi:Arm DNA-binding domain-containing protein [Novosphingobium rosa]|uniref:Arm DNA-binding domain-containing protein n=1 Tax=Novosphingobium rosa TaxID=76978 RepID=UPI0038991103